jgi:hypothetical protein
MIGLVNLAPDEDEYIFDVDVERAKKFGKTIAIEYLGMFDDFGVPIQSNLIVKNCAGVVGEDTVFPGPFLDVAAA